MRPVFEKFRPNKRIKMLSSRHVGITKYRLHKLNQQKVSLQRATEGNLCGQLVITISQRSPKLRLQTLKSLANRRGISLC